MTYFDHYVAYNEKGGIEKKISRKMMEQWLDLYEKYGHPILGVWEFRRDDTDIHVRMTPARELDGYDNNWRSWNYTFVPYIP